MNGEAKPMLVGISLTTACESNSDRMEKGYSTKMSVRFATVFGLLAVLLLGQASAQTGAADSRADPQDAGKPPPLALRARIPLPGIYGRMDHYGWGSKRGVLIVSALGNDTVEIVNSWKRVHTITGLEHPQASLYVPGVDRIAVSSQSGKLRFCEAETYKLLKTLEFGTDADTDNVRYDPLSKKIYVGQASRAEN